MAHKTSIGRRVVSFNEVEKAGDYYGPVTEGPLQIVSVYFLLPIARDEGVPPGARSIHRVASPPHEFRECSDGSLEITGSIGAYGHNTNDQGFVWHGWLQEGHRWEEI